MRKALPILLLLAALATGAFFYFRHEPDPGTAAGSAARFAPADCAVFLEFPDVQRTLQRWEGTALARMSVHADWNELFTKLDELLRSDLPHQNINRTDLQLMSGQPRSGFIPPLEAQRISERLINEYRYFAGLMFTLSNLRAFVEAEPARLFIAFPSARGTQKYVGGFTCRAKKTVVNGVIDRWKAGLLQAEATRRSELMTHAGTDIEVLVGKEQKVAFAFWNEWFFYSNNVEEMKGLLERCAKQGSSHGGSLAENPMFRQYQSLHPPDPEADLFGFGFGKVDPMEVIGGWQPYRPEALQYTLKIEGEMIRDRFYARIPKLPKVTPMANRLLALAPANTTFFAALNSAGSDEWRRLLTAEWLESTLWAGPKVSQRIEYFQQEMEEYRETFGPEFSMVRLPAAAFAAMGLRDEAKAGKLAHRVVSAFRRGSIFDGPIVVKRYAPSVLALRPGYVAYGDNRGDRDEPWVAGVSLGSATDGMEKAASRQAGAPSTFQKGWEHLPQPTYGVAGIDFATLWHEYAVCMDMERFNLLHTRSVACQALTGFESLPPVSIVLADAPEGLVAESLGALPGGLLFSPIGMKIFPYFEF